MIFTRDFVTRENHWRIASLVTQKSLFTVTHALFFISSSQSRVILDNNAANSKTDDDAGVKLSADIREPRHSSTTQLQNKIGHLLDIIRSNDILLKY